VWNPSSLHRRRLLHLRRPRATSSSPRSHHHVGSRILVFPSRVLDSSATSSRRRPHQRVPGYILSPQVTSSCLRPHPDVSSRILVNPAASLFPRLHHCAASHIGEPWLHPRARGHNGEPQTTSPAPGQILVGSPMTSCCRYVLLNVLFDIYSTCLTCTCNW
jgi:hypothetical protein